MDSRKYPLRAGVRDQGTEATPLSSHLNKGGKRGVAPILLEIFHRLYQRFGPQHWWPGETPFEVIVGAVLTQGTSWKNVEKALEALRQRDLLTPDALYQIPETDLAQLIRPCGFFNVKARRLKTLTEFIYERYHGSLDQMFSQEKEALREQLLFLKGIGPETADSILLYAGKMPIFVVDAYTRRIFSRHDLIDENDDYHHIQIFLMNQIPYKAQIYNEYHALIVKTGKLFCKTEANCLHCPLGDLIGFSLDNGEKNASLKS